MMQWRSLARGLLVSGAVLAVTGGETQAQLCQPRCQPCSPPACQPCPSAPPGVPEPPKVDQPPIIEPTFAPEQATAASDYYAAAPNMIGDLFGNIAGVSFGYSSALQPFQVDLATFGNLINAKIAENNSPLPMDRVAFRYNYFHNASVVEGPANPVPLPNGGAFFTDTTTRQYDTHAFNFSLEKTFFNDLCSVELRVPFFSTLGSDLDLAVGRIEGEDPSVFVPDTANAFGDSDGQFGDLQVVLKGLLYYTSQFAVAGGLGIGIPTGRDNRVIVEEPIFPFAIRTREFRIDNEQWSLSPYLAALVRPSERLFFHGFYQFYFPVGENQVTFQEDLNLLFTSLPPLRLTGQGELEGQTLMMVDAGVGYWCVRNANGRGLTGLAPTLELHYTTALEDADILTLPNDNLPNPLVAAPQIGNFRNRFDFLDLTMGATAEFGNRLLIAAGVVVPLRDEDDRFFDWEFQVQVNYRFGPAPSYLLPPL